MTAHRFVRVPLFAALLSTVLLAPANASGRPFGALAQLGGRQDCFSSAPRQGCGQTLQGADTGVGAVAVSPDGRNLYAGSGAHGSILEFRRYGNGSLHQLPAPNDCLGGADSGRLCASTALGLQDPSGVAISPGGQNMYVASTGGDAVVELARAASGVVRPLRGANACIGLAASPDAGGLPCPRQSPGLGEPEGLAISPNGRYVYVASWYTDTLDVFARGRGGALRYLQCVQERGLAGRYLGTAGCASTAYGLQDPQKVVVSPDGRDIYVSGEQSRSVAVFARQRGGRVGQLTCFGQSGFECSGTGLDLEQADGLAISANGRSVYLGARSLLLPLRRSRNGRLHLLAPGRRCLGAPGSGCPEPATGASSIDSLSVSGDGRNVYGTGYASDALLAFSRARSGALRQLPAPFSCLSPYPYSGCRLNARGLWSPAMVTVSPGGHSVYASGQESDALVLFARHTG